MSKWSNISDHEIDCMIVDSLGLLSDCHISKDKITKHCNNCVVLNQAFEISYCKNWSDIGPLIEDNNISLLNENNEWEAEITYMANTGLLQLEEEHSHFHTNENPKRAAAIVYLISKGVKV